MAEPLILTVAPTGASTTRAQTPHVPLTPEEIAADAAACEAAGAAIVHVHVRDDDGRPSMDSGRLRATVAAIRERTGLIVNVSTAGRDEHDEAERTGALDVEPELASLDAGSMNFGDGVFVNPPPFLRRLAAAMRERGIRPEIEVFDGGQAANARRLVEAGLIEPPLWFGLVLGVAGGLPASVPNLLWLRRQLPPGAHASAIAVGRHQLPLTTAAIAAGLHARVGMEDNVWYAPGRLAASNAEFVARAARIAAELGRPLASIAETRRLLGLRGAS